MRLSNVPSPRRAISLTPLIDVVFLLLVFFMLASTFMKFSSLPVTTTGSDTATITDPRAIALIHVASNGRLIINGEPFNPTNFERQLTHLHTTGTTQVIIAVRPGATVADLTRALGLTRRVPFKSIRVVD